MGRLLLLLIISSVAAAPALARPGSEPAAVAGTTIVSASKSGFVDVAFPREARLSNRQFRNPDLDFEGGGRVVGLVLVRLGLPREEALELDLTRWSFCGGRGCEPRRPVEFAMATNWRDSHWTDDQWVIPPGNYRMYVITDGADVRLEVTFSGLTGEAHLSPSHPATIGVRVPHVTTPRDQENVVVAEDTFEMTSPGLMVEAVREAPELGIGLNAACYGRGDSDLLRRLQEDSCGWWLGTDSSPSFSVTWQIFG